MLNWITKSPIIAMYQALQTMQPRWYVEIGTPRGPGWITGTDLRSLCGYPCTSLLGTE